MTNPAHRFNLNQWEMLGSIVGQKKLHLLEIQEHQPDLNMGGSSNPCCFFMHYDLYGVIQHELFKIASLFFLFNCWISFSPDDGLRINRNVE